MKELDDLLGRLAARGGAPSDEDIADVVGVNGLVGGLLGGLGVHPDHHEQMAKEFAQELEEHGRIYGYRFRPEASSTASPSTNTRASASRARPFRS